MTKGRIRKRTDQVEVDRTDDQESGGWTRRLAIRGREGMWACCERSPCPSWAVVLRKIMMIRKSWSYPKQTR